MKKKTKSKSRATPEGRARQLAALKPTQWKKGAPSANPLGAQLHNPELRRIKTMTAVDVAELGALVLENNTPELERISKSKQEKVLRVWFATIALEAIRKKDSWLMDALLNRIIGKVPERSHVALTGARGGPVEFSNLTREERAVQLEELRLLREKAGDD